jgi:hypothetical protein
MDKGIRPAMNAKFLELLPKRASGELTNTKFRAEVMGFGQKEYGISVASAATHYNHAFKEARKAAAAGDETLQKQLEGLGRPEDKKGGRKKKAAAPATPNAATTIQANPAAASGTDTAANDAQGAVTTTAEAGGETAAGTAQEGQTINTEEVGKVDVVLGDQPEQAANETVATDVVQEVSIDEQSVWAVKKPGPMGIGEGKIIAEKLTKAAALELIDRAAKSKKGKLELVAPKQEPAEAA